MAGGEGRRRHAGVVTRTSRAIIMLDNGDILHDSDLLHGLDVIIIDSSTLRCDAGYEADKEEDKANDDRGNNDSIH
eukprot:CAMPEP_0168615478 /NCGR_PEP_ID=MMETSP0449_2-20121227/4524_1 /TAXON_ID=1082188 /ORGANISM="Strombidium rassoulzadegani, Strain ras09" /LENGTH=75 /DNA_ID=CAMNT_0008656217 /DNA_START=181 /DNA_END=408 /DNA_ORIENTATION=+